MSVPKTRCNGRWTESRYRSFITSMLRRGSMRWAVKSDVKMEARLPEKLRNKKGREVFHTTCSDCKSVVPETESAIDHVSPVVDPTKGFTTWDDFIYRLFCEADNLQVLCNECHTVKSNKEKAIAKARRKNEHTTSSK